MNGPPRSPAEKPSWKLNTQTLNLEALGVAAHAAAHCKLLPRGRMLNIQRALPLELLPTRPGGALWQLSSRLHSLHPAVVVVTGVAEVGRPEAEPDSDATEGKEGRRTGDDTRRTRTGKVKCVRK